MLLVYGGKIYLVGKLSLTTCLTQNGAPKYLTDKNHNITFTKSLSPSRIWNQLWPTQHLLAAEVPFKMSDLLNPIIVRLSNVTQRYI